MLNHNLTDNEIWMEVRKDDAKAFAVLFDRYWSILFKTAFHHLGDHDASTGIVQDIFLNIWVGRHELSIISFPNYLKAACRYHVFKHIRSARKSPLQLNENIESAIVIDSSNSEDRVIYSELEDQVYGHIKKLPKRCQEIFILSRKQHLTNDQIADMLGISKRSVENQITHALQHLRLSMKELFILAIVFHFK